MAVIVTAGKPVLLIPSTVDLVVDWLKSVTAIKAIIDPGSRISSSLPVRDEDIVYPWLTVGRVIGLPVIPEAGIDRARISFNAWGGVTTSGAPNWSGADLLIRTIEQTIDQTMSVQVTGKGFIMSVSGLEGTQQLVDPDTNGARFWMDAIVVTRGERPVV
jgi:hypothetical protein